MAEHLILDDREPAELEIRVTRDGKRPSYESLQAVDPQRMARFHGRFALLIEMARTVGSGVGYQAVLERLMEIIFKAVAPERAALALLEEGGKLRLEAARHARSQDPWRDLRLSGTILSRVIASGTAFLIADAAHAAEMQHVRSIAQQQIRSAMCVPFHWRGQIGGALYVDHRGSASYFAEDDLDFLIVLSHLASVALQNVKDYQAARAEVEQLRDAAAAQSELVGESPAMRELERVIARVARSSQPLLIQGERGTGKELVARAVHRQSGRGPFVAVNCAAIPEQLVESVLFGHERGAFTGADRQHQGCFEQAQGGTLFLDEIGDLKPPSQAAILRALQEGEVCRVGSPRPIRVEVRVISATNRDLAAAIVTGEFRPDLHDRLNVLQIAVPPLRERADDIPLLAAHFAASRAGRISARALRQLRDYSWPGNVRELKNVVERAIVMGDGETIWPEDLPGPIRDGKPGHYHLVSLETVERDHIIRVLRQVRGNVSRAAEVLGVRRITVYKKLKGYGLDVQDFKPEAGGQ